MTREFALIGLICLVLAGCSEGGDATAAVPREPGPDAAGYFCRMALKEHQGPKGQILPRGWKEPLWFSSVNDALTYLEQEIVSDRELAGFWVNDMAQGTWEKPATGSWVEAAKAWYVVGSDKSSGMGGTEAVPFKARNDAEVFVREHGGRVVDYLAARRAVTEAPSVGAGAGGAI